MTPTFFPLVRRVAAGIVALGMLGAPSCQTEPDTITPEPQPLMVKTDADLVDPVLAKVYPEPPPPSQPRPVNFPKIATFVASNGIRVFVVENHEVPTVSTQLVVRAGTLDSEYLAAFAAGMLGEGTSARSKAKIDEAIEFVGGSLGAIPGQHTTIVFTHSLQRDLKLALVLMADEVMKATFPPDALVKIKQRARAGLRMASADPKALADRMFNHVAYPQGHPYGRLLPTEAEIVDITVADVKEFYSTFYRPNNAFLIFSGDVTADEARPIVERTFARWAKVDESKLPINPLNKFKRYTVPAELVVHIVDRPGSEQVEVRVGTVALARNHEDWVPLQVANNILGDDAGGRLFQDLREDKGLTYGIYSSVQMGQAPGTFQVATSTGAKTLGQMLAGIFGHLQRMRTEEPSAEEFEATVQKMIGQFPLQVETASHIVDKVQESLVYGLANDYWSNYRDEIRSVKRSDIQRVAQRYIHPIPHVVLVGDAALIKAQVSTVLTSAKIKLYGTDLLPK